MEITEQIPKKYLEQYYENKEIKWSRPYRRTFKKKLNPVNAINMGKNKLF